jgi:uncharacterized protein (TIGR03437 family)
MYVATQSYDQNGSGYSATGYTAVDGTSLSAALVAGAAALVKQAHPTWTPGQIKSALLDYAAQDVTTDDFNDLTDVRWLGAGRLDANAAVNATVSAEPATLSFGYLTPGTAMPGPISVTITNLGSAPVTLAAAVAPGVSASGTTVTVDQSSITLAAGANTTLNVSLSGTVPNPGSYNGAVTLTSFPPGVAMQIPYMFLARDGVPFNAVALFGCCYGAVGSDLGALPIRVTDQYGVPVAGAPVAWTVSPQGAVTLNSGTGKPGNTGNDALPYTPVACSPASSSAGVTCQTDNYGVAWVDVVGGTTATSQATLCATVGNFSCSGGSGLQFGVNLIPAPNISSGGVVDYGSGQPLVVPGSYADILGTNLMDPNWLSNSSGDSTAYSRLPMTLDGVTVSFDAPASGNLPAISVPGHVDFVSPGDVNLYVPWELENYPSAQVKVTFNEVMYSNLVNVAISKYAPAFLLNKGAVADAWDSTGAQITSGNPATCGQTVQLWAIGLGPVTNQPTSGDPASASPLSRTTSPVTVAIGGQPATVSGGTAFLAPGYVGMYQVNVQVPPGVGAGNQPIAISAGGQTSPATSGGSPVTLPMKACTTPFSTLTVTKSGAGSGTVTSSPAGINCGSTCSAQFPNGTQVTLTETPAAGSTFGGWSGACSGTGTCLVTVDAAKTATATFVAQSGPITVSPATAAVETGVTQQFTAATTGATNLPLTWSVNSMVGGNSVVGTISATGLYSAPAVVPNPSIVTVTAVLGASTSGSATVLVQPKCQRPAAGVTDANGLVTLCSGGFTVPIALTDAASGLVGPGLAVAIGVDPAQPGWASVVIADPTGAHPLKFLLLQAGAASTASAQLHRGYAFEDASAPGSPIGVSLCGGAGAVYPGADPPILTGVLSSPLPPPPPPPTFVAGAPDPAWVQFSELVKRGLSSLITLDDSFLPSWLRGTKLLSITTSDPIPVEDFPKELASTVLEVIANNGKEAITGVLKASVVSSLKWPEIELMSTSELVQATMMGAVGTLANITGARAVVLKTFSVPRFELRVAIPIYDAPPKDPSFNAPVLPVQITNSKAGGPVPMGSVALVSKGVLDFGISGSTDSQGKVSIPAPAGQYTLAASAPGFACKTQDVTVQQQGSSAVTVSLPPSGPSAANVLHVSPTSISFTGTVGQPNPASETLLIDSDPSGLTWIAGADAGWLGLTPPTGATPKEVSVSANIAGMQPGNYSATITIMASGAAPVRVPVTLEIESGDGVTPTSIKLGTVGGCTNSTVSQTFQVSAPSNVTWRVSYNINNFILSGENPPQISPLGGTGSGTFTLKVNAPAQTPLGGHCDEIDFPGDGGILYVYFSDSLMPTAVTVIWTFGEVY